MDGIARRARVQRMHTEAQKWADALIDLGPYNTLLHFRDTKSTTVDITDCPQEALGRVVAGGKVRLASLFPDSVDHSTACARARGLRRKVVELDEEQGVEAGRLAHGLLNIAVPTTRGVVPVPPLRAPLLLQPLTILPRTVAENDFVLQTGGEVEINPVLLYALDRQYGMDGNAEDLAVKAANALEECVVPGDRLGTVYELFEQALRRSRLTVTLENRLVAGVFNFDRLPMVNDLRNSAELLAEHPVIAALAGEEEATRSLEAPSGGREPVGADEIHPRSEYLVHDADSSQQRAISAALAGEHLVVEGPPGTGKSQTIANLIAAFSAQGRKVLFVAEKRAAIEAVTDRLARVELSGLVFDLHASKLNRRQIAQQLQESLERAGQEQKPRLGDLHHRLDYFRQRSGVHVQEYHQPHSPWQVSAYDALTALPGCPPAHHTRRRIRGQALQSMDRTALERAERDLRRFVSTDGLQIRRGESPWARTAARDIDELRPALDGLDVLTGAVFYDTRREMDELIFTAGLRPPAGIAGWQEVLSLLQAVAATLEQFQEGVYGPLLPDLVAATADRAWRRSNNAKLGWTRRRPLLKVARSLRRDGLRDRRALHQSLSGAWAQSQRWKALAATADATPAAVPGLADAMQHFGLVRERLLAVAMCARLEGWETKPTQEVADEIENLDNDRQTLLHMPEHNQLTDRLQAAGLGPLLDDLARLNADPDTAVGTLHFLWWSSVLDEITLKSSYIRGFNAREHEHNVAEFRRSDSEHLAANAQRVRYQVATRLRQVRDVKKDQNALVRSQASRKTRHLSLRKLLESAPDVLLAAKPCWAMSPLVVSRVLPARRLFDVVIFDEASQVLPHDAIASIMRAQQVIVAGDPHQLPPTFFFTRQHSGAVDQNDESEEEELVDVPPDAFESLLDMLSSKLPQVHRLRWHYRSTDERLIAFSNHHIYDDDLVTFPGTTVESPVRLVSVDGHAEPGQAGSAPEEVQRVVELVLEHATVRPDKSLGVITMGQRHGDRIEAALRSALSDRPELSEFFSPEAGPGKRFFVKNLERVQGDERDAIILSIGYAKAASGRLNMSFGPLINEGGERRLNVAVSRARESMTLVSSFTHQDFDPERLRATKHRGPGLLRDFIEYCANRGDLGRTSTLHAEYQLNPFEQQVFDVLEAQDIPVTPQLGVGEYRIDFALGHPERPSQMLLAVETDGDRYHRAPSARDRDRLRQAHLERLGWRFHRIWAADWFRNPAHETARLVEEWKGAVQDVQRTPALSEPQAPPPPASEDQSEARRRPRPAVVAGMRIIEYSDSDLTAIASWILSDGFQLDRDARVAEAMAELGFKKRGKVIVDRLERAFDRAQQISDKENLG
ncbi:AAA domain-containing protein [Streptomyces sp. NBC_00448]|uniref:AAA domain-containing protein n=1 Tax=Streptomyces sp. NBC_00448 TaxID=2903652 RepID=UPI002E23894A